MAAAADDDRRLVEVERGAARVFGLEVYNRALHHSKGVLHLDRILEATVRHASEATGQLCPSWDADVALWFHKARGGSVHRRRSLDRHCAAYGFPNFQFGLGCGVDLLS